MRKGVRCYPILRYIGCYWYVLLLRSVPACCGSSLGSNPGISQKSLSARSTFAKEWPRRSCLPKNTKNRIYIKSLRFSLKVGGHSRWATATQPDAPGQGQEGSAVQASGKRREGY
jgi:hypothetical protein